MVCYGNTYVLEIIKLIEYVNRKEYPLIQIVRTHQQDINSAMLLTPRRLKKESETGTRQIKDSIVPLLLATINELSWQQPYRKIIKYRKDSE